jgi:hypothetical protein
MRMALIVGVAVLVALGVVVVTQSGSRNSAPDVTGEAPGVFHDAPFTIRIDGPLWRARTLQDNDGAQDFALVEGDLPLDVRVTGGRVGKLELRVDGRTTRVVSSSSARFVPPLAALPAGEHRVDVLVRDRGGHARVNGFDVHYVSNVPPTTEGETVSKTASPVPGSDVAPRTRDSALRVLAAARRSGSGGIASVLGNARLTVVETGRLDTPGGPLGVTMLVGLTPARYDVSAVLPAYVPIAGSGGVVRYAQQEVQMHVAVLRDALIDVDVASGRVISLEPGPQSRTLSWSPSKAPVPAGAADED